MNTSPRPPLPGAGQIPYEAAAELRLLLSDGRCVDDERFADLFADELFTPVDGMSPAENAERSYRGLRHVGSRMEPARELVSTGADRFFSLHEWAAVVDPTMVSMMTIHYNLCIGTIAALGGGRPEIDALLGELERMDSIGVFLATELGYGNNVAAMRTKAVYDREADEFVITTPGPEARKFMPNTGLSGVAKLGVVLARLEVEGRDEGVFPFVVRIRDGDGTCPGVRVQPLGDKPGLALDNAITTFDGVRVPRAHLLDGGEDVVAGGGAGSASTRRLRFARAMQRVQTGKVCLTSGVVAAARAGVYIAVRYGNRRRVASSGRSVPVMAHRTHHDALLAAMAEMYAMTFLVNAAKRLHSSGRDAGSGEAKHELAITKAVASWAAQDAIATCRERCGAQGMFSRNRIATYVALAQGTVTAEGDNQVVLLDAAHEMLLGLAYTPPADAAPDMAAPDSLRTPEQLARLFRHRERRLYDDARSLLADTRRSGADAFTTWNTTSPRAAEFGRAHGVRRAVEEFAEAVARAEHEESRELLGSVLLRFALAEVSRDASWYLCEGVLSPDQVRGLPDLVAELDLRLLPHSEELVGAFGVSNDLLGAPIASDDYFAAYDDAG
ncbi:acyl-CoA dehydrogenase family protein [Actinorugispora endophytica]|uniref:acyl-CoA dehydrogenase family protein n=1 Tax=Actinorugispora endophytica TaxID=1605990 RepID=UPI001061442F|nr:acyl-CoA dehydrogenase [Actinorugispora endophytica]